MLDKSVSFIPITMFRPSNAPSLPKIQLPEGYHFVSYQLGDAQAWCRIETAVQEFETEADTAFYFEKAFAPFSNELQRRMLFIENPKGEKVATFTAWWTEEKAPRLHWLGVLPTEQRKGLARALAIRVTQLLHDYYPEQDLYLTTQTWSHVAVKLYQKLNYQIIRNQDYQNIINILNAAEK